MLKKHTQLFEALFVASDLIVASAAWALSYWIRFESNLLTVEKGIPEIMDYARILLFVWLIWAYVFRRFKLYRPKRGSNRGSEIWKVIRANSLSVILLLALTYLFREKSVPFSRLVFLVFWMVSTVMLVGSRLAIRQFLRAMRKRGYNLRHVLVVGSGELAENVVRGMEAHPEYGTVCVGCLAAELPRVPGPKLRVLAGSELYEKEYNVQTQLFLDRPQDVPAVGVEIAERIIGTYEDLPKVLKVFEIDSVIIAMPLQDHEHLEQVVGLLGDEMVDVRIVPDVHRFIRLGSQIEDFDGMPVVSLNSTPIFGVNRVVKRVFDIVFGMIFLLLSVPVMALTAILVKLSSSGPVFFSQERVGLDGEVFSILKFRTMKLDAEKDGAQFAVKGDTRVTRLGGFLRKFNIDELPQLLNVVRGQMSLVGPRPERPVFIKEFRKHFPGYMLRHKVQAGMTGWAQVNGWRGNTSIEKRIEHDLYYIENWSVLLDFKIILKTFIDGFRDQNAY